MSKIEILRPINTSDYMDYKPIEAAEIADYYGQAIAKAAHFTYLVEIEKNPYTKKRYEQDAQANEIIAYQYGMLLEHGTETTQSRIDSTIKVIKRAAAAGKPYRLPYDDVAYYPDGTSILLHWSEL